MKKVILVFALLAGLITSAATLTAQTVNTSRYITLTVVDGAAIKLDFKAAAAGTPVRIVSGSNTRDITVDTSWYDGRLPSSNFTVTADGTEMKVYGDLTGFRCSYNNENLTALDATHHTQLTELDCNSNRLSSLDVSNNTLLTKLWCYSNQLSSLDVSHNTQLMTLSCSDNLLSSLNVSHNTLLTQLICYNNRLSSLDVSNCTDLQYVLCHDNPLSTAALDRLYCSLPDRGGKEAGKIQPIKNASSSNAAAVAATTKGNATTKNWNVLYYDGDTDIPATTGSYVCPSLNTSRYITLTVADGEAIDLDFKSAAAAGTLVRVVSGSNTQNIIVDTAWIGTDTYTADGTELKVYGDLTGFNCSYNGANLTALDLSHNTQLEELNCEYNQLTSLDLSNNTQLKELNCESNQLTSLDLSNNTQLETLNCPENQLTVLDLSHNTQLKELECESNQLTSLDLSNNTQLKELECFSNQLTSLNVSNCTQLTKLWCFFNQLTVLDVSHNTQLTELRCYSNRLSSLDVSNNTQLTVLECYSNQLSSLDVSHNTQLEELECMENRFSTEDIDHIYCQLPDRGGKSAGKIYLLRESSPAAEAAIATATNAANATSKNWKVQTYRIGSSHTDIATTGSYVCPSLNMSRYITLTVADGEAIKLNFKAAAAGTPVQIKSGSNMQNITVGTDWYDDNSPSTFTVTAAATTMTVYGDVTVFDCSENGANLTSLDLSHNTQLTELYCYSNRLTALDVSNCTKLERLNCSANQFTSLDVSNCTDLQYVFCYHNRFSTEALDSLYCQLPDRTSKLAGMIFPLDESSSAAEQAAVKATNAANATSKNWKVQTFKNSLSHTDIATTGSYDCTATGIAAASAAEPLALYPNPAGDELHLTVTVRNIYIYNMYGVEVARAADTDRIDVANLPAGVYTVRADGTVLKMVKR